MSNDSHSFTTINHIIHFVQTGASEPIEDYGIITYDNICIVDRTWGVIAFASYVPFGKNEGNYAKAKFVESHLASRDGEGQHNRRRLVVAYNGSKVNYNTFQMHIFFTSSHYGNDYYVNGLYTLTENIQQQYETLKDNPEEQKKLGAYFGTQKLFPFVFVGTVSVAIQSQSWTLKISDVPSAY